MIWGFITLHEIIKGSLSAEFSYVGHSYDNSQDEFAELNKFKSVGSVIFIFKY